MEQGDDFERVLADQRARLEQLRAPGATAPQSVPGDDVVSTAGDGAIRVVMRDRRLTSVVIASHLTGQSRRAAAEPLRQAINDALSRSLAEQPKAGDPGPNLAAIGDQLAEATQQSSQALRRIQGAVEENMAKLAGKVQIGGDASPQYVDFLFEDAMEVVRSMQSALAGNQPAPITVEARDESQEVTAVVTDGELTELALTSGALAMSPGELGQGVSEAVNTAVAEWERRSAAAERPPVDVDALRKLGERASAVRAQSMQHLKNYTDSMTSIMRNVD
ncbi:hypothetical protein D5S17_03835 [Pseudonocardiaceae bacterium YIM PH 21723]|nr:hypothetical protein D5S17_03835 [Pseudonocardiaceae bacterium YIM PH 21723]